MLEYHSIASLVRAAEEKNCAISDIALEDQASVIGAAKENVFAVMKRNLDVMRKSAETGMAQNAKSRSGLSGGDAFRMRQYIENAEPVSGGFPALAMAKAIAISECNAGMGRIVAAPTAGSCGILPGILLAAEEFFHTPEDKLVMALFTAGAAGLVIVHAASVSGAEGGCQAECGSAAAMAAAALTELRGGSPSQAASAFAFAVKNQLGLVCDPVAGLVEVPCVKRNAGSVMCAIGAADMALAGIKSVIPADEALSAMREVGDMMSVNLRETALGGLAATPTGLALKQRIFG